jgi:hypothetical protein
VVNVMNTVHPSSRRAFSSALPLVASGVVCAFVAVSAFALWSRNAQPATARTLPAPALPALAGVEASAQPATITPAMTSGTFSGLHLTQVREGSLFQSMGLHTGDVVESLHTLERPDGSTRTIVHLRRDQKPLALTYTSAASEVSGAAQRSEPFDAANPGNQER